MKRRLMHGAKDVLADKETDAKGIASIELNDYNYEMFKSRRKVMS